MNEVYSLTKQRSLLSSSLLLLTATMIMNLSNYGFQLYMSRHLTTISYGALNSLLSLFMILSVPTNSVLMVVSRYITKHVTLNELDKAKTLFHQLFKRISFLAGGVFILFVALSPIISSYLKVNSLLPVFIIGTVVFFAFIMPIPLGALQGLQRFGYLGLGFALLGLLRLGSGVFFEQGGGGLNGALGASLFAYGVVFFLALAFLRGSFHPQDVPLEGELKEVFRYSFPVLISLLSLMTLTNSDMILIKHYFPAEDAGLYAAVAVLGRTILYIPTAIVLALFPMVTELHILNQDTFKLLRKALLYTLILSGVGVGAFLIAPQFLISFLFSQKFSPVAPLLRLYGVAMLSYSLLNVLMSFNLARRSAIFIYSFIAAAVIQISLICTFHRSLQEILYIIIVSGLALLLFNLLLLYHHKRKIHNARQSS